MVERSSSCSKYDILSFQVLAHISELKSSDHILPSAFALLRILGNIVLNMIQSSLFHVSDRSSAINYILTLDSFSDFTHLSTYCECTVRQMILQIRNDFFTAEPQIIARVDRNRNGSINFYEMFSVFTIFPPCKNREPTLRNSTLEGHPNLPRSRF